MKLFNSVIKGALLLVVINFNLAHADNQIYTGYFNNKAVSGFDVMSYFNDKKPTKGVSKFTFEYKGADWYFSSNENLQSFKSNPERFAPQYGGYCAWAMASNKTAPGNAPFWDVYQGKLYLNYDQKIFDAWQENKDDFINKADSYWAKRVLDK